MPLIRLFAALLLVLSASACTATRCQPTLSVAGRPADRAAAALAAARSAWQDLERGGGAHAEQRYNAALRQFLHEVCLHDLHKAAAQGISVRPHGTEWRITFDPANAEEFPAAWAPGEFERVELAEEVPVSPKVIRNQTTVPGLGLPVVMACDDTRHLRARRPYRPRNGEFLPATAVLEFRGPQSATLRFHNTLRRDSVRIGGRSRQLASNFSAAIHLALGNDYVTGLGLRGLFFPGDQMEDLGLFFPCRYDSKKIPVIFLHGLSSDPRIWQNAVAELVTDPVLRQRFQPACFTYPTGLPVPASAERLRACLALAKKSLDPENDDAGFKKMILIGHSMGGLVSRMQVIDSGEAFWQAFFTVPPKKLAESVKGPLLEQLTASLHFRRNPDIARVVFLCTPHRGSDAADIRLVRLLAGIIRLPASSAVLITKILAAPFSPINPELKKFRALGTRGTETLSPEHPFFTALASRPIAVPYHSIIANRGKPGDLSKSTDGLVSYSSAHLDGAVTEAVVPHYHPCVEAKATVDAVLEILRHHAGK